MDNHLLSAFVSSDPERFAQLLGDSNDQAEAIAILTDIPDGREGDVIARLSPEAAARLLKGLPEPVVIGWLQTCSTDSARRMLARIGHERSTLLISGIEDRAKRRELRRLVEYPSGTIGELMQVNVTSVHDSTRVADIRKELQRRAGDPDAPVTVVRDDGTVLGVLDLVKLLQNRDPDSRAGKFLIQVKPVFADASLTSLRGRAEWARLTSLPVVDFEGRLMGYVSRARFESSQGTGGERIQIVYSVVEFSKLFLEFMVYVLELMFGRRTSR